MAKKILRLPSISRVSANSRAILELPIGPTYKRIVFAGTAGAGLAIGQVGRIDVNVNAKTIQTFKNLQRVFDLNAFYARGADRGRPAGAGGHRQDRIGRPGARRRGQPPTGCVRARAQRLARHRSIQPEKIR